MRSRGPAIVGLVLGACALVFLVALHPWSADSRPQSAGDVWPGRIQRPDIAVVGGRVLEVASDGTHLRDVRDGRPLPAVLTDSGATYLAPDGSFLHREQTGVGLVSFSRDGKRRWRRAGTEELAALGTAKGMTAVSSCRTTSFPERCRVLGLDVRGRTRWSHAGTGRKLELATSVPASGFSSTRLLPNLVVVGRGAAGLEVLDPASGRVLARAGRRSATVAAPGRMLLVPRGSLTARRCRIDAVGRRGHEWTARVPCRGPLLVRALSTRGYAGSGGAAISFDLRTGTWRRLPGGVVLGPGKEGAIGGESVVARRTGGQVHVVDAASGRALWSRSVPGLPASRLRVERDVVLVLATRKARSRLLVFDARTGNRRGALVTRTRLWGAVAVGGGRVLAIDGKGVHHVLG